MNSFGLKASETDIYQTVQAEHTRFSGIMNYTRSDKVTEKDKFVKQFLPLAVVFYCLSVHHKTIVTICYRRKLKRNIALTST